MKSLLNWPVFSTLIWLLGVVSGGEGNESEDVTPIPNLTAKAVNDAAFAGCTDLEIARRHLVTEELLRDRYGADLEIARGNRAFALRKAQSIAAFKGNGPLLTWLGRNELGQSLSPTTPGEAEPGLEQKCG